MKSLTLWGQLEWYRPHLAMAATCFYPKRNGDYVYDVTVAKDEAVRLSHR